MSTWFTSDLHFSHGKIIEYCDRPFTGARHMDETLIANWNAVVQPDDHIYVLGDVFFCGSGIAVNIMNQLQGRKHLVLGNHDRLLRKDAYIRSLFEILPDLHAETIDGIHVVMCHYPLLTWNGSGRGSFHLHGHQHNKIAIKDTSCRRYDVGVDANNYAPVEWQDIKRQLESLPEARGREK